MADERADEAEVTAFLDRMDTLATIAAAEGEISFASAEGVHALTGIMRMLMYAGTHEPEGEE